MPQHPTLAGAGSFIGSVSAGVSGTQGSITIFPHIKQPLNGEGLVIITSQNTDLPQLAVSDLDGSTFTPVAGQPSNIAQFTYVFIVSHPNGGDNVTIVFPNVIHPALFPVVTIEYFNPAGQ
jgi:hypothetical protein